MIFPHAQPAASRKESLVSPTTPSWPVRYGLAAACAAAAILLRLALDPLLHDELPLLTLFPAIAVAVWYAGSRPALLTLLLGYLGARYLFIEPRGAIPLRGSSEIVGLLGYLLSALIIVGFGDLFLRGRRRAERSARAATEQGAWLRTTLASIGDGVITTDTQGRVSFLNSVARDLTGWSADAAAGQPLDSVFNIRNEVTGQKVENPAGRALREGRVVGLGSHTLLVARDGTQRPVEDSASAIKGEGDQVSGVVLVFRDVTERRKLEALQRDHQSQLERLVEARTAELRRSEAQFRLLVEGTSEYAIYLLDPSGRITSWNPGAEAIKGYRAEEILGEHFSRFYLPGDVQTGKPERELEIASRDGKFAEENWRLRKDGSRFWGNVLITALRDEAGTLQGFSKITSDQTRRKQAEESARLLIGEQAARQEAERSAGAIQVQREQLRVTLRSIGDAVIATDAAGKVTMLNAVAEQLTGWTEPQAVGQLLETVFRIQNEDSGQSIESPAARVVREGTVVGLGNHTELIARDGSARPIDDSAAPIRDAEGKLVGVVLVFRDVTERRRAERAIRESEARKAAFLETALDGVVTMDHEGKVLEFNPAAERMFGYAEAEVLGRELAELLVPASLRERHRRGLAHFLATGEGPVLNRRVEMPALREDGSEFPVELSITRIPTSGLPVFTAHIHDITERVKGERRRSARLAVTQVLASAPSLHVAASSILQALGESLAWDVGVLWLIDPRDRLLRCESFWRPGATGAEHFERVTRASAFPTGVGLPGRVWQSGKPAWIPDLARDDNFPRASVAVGDGLHGAFAFPIGHGGEVFGVMEFFSGKVREPDPDLLEMVTTLGGQIAQFIERRRAEQTAHFLADASASLATLVDIQSTLQNVAALVVPFFADWCTVDLLGADGSLSRVAVAHRDPSKVAEAESADRADAQDPNAAQGVWQVLRTGRSELLESAIRVALRIRGRTVGVISCIATESGRNYGAADLAVAEDLSHRVAVAMENASLYAELRDADRKKDEFLAILSHELRNPLAPLGNALELMKRSGGDPAVMDKALGLMQRQLGQLVRLVDDLLDVSRIARNQPELRKEPIQLAEVLRSAIETSLPLIEQRGHRLFEGLPAEPIWLEADLTRLAQVFANLLNNSAKYTQPGGRIWLSVTGQDHEVAVSVRDSGIGIPAGMLSRIFEMFSQGDRSLERSQGGLGIGLSLVKRLVELHGGSVTASSDGEGRGSEFVVRLPVLASGFPASPGPGVELQAPALQHRRILVVDDNRDSATSLAMVLELMGSETRTAFDGPSAIEMAERFRPDLVFLDIGLPKLNGFDTCRRIREQPWGKHIVIVALTGWGQEEDKRRSAEAGFSLHLVKPVAPAELESLLTG
jgi:PAS domain S-box-containing protein